MKQPTDFKYMGIPNLCFSLTDEDDHREPEYIKQRIKYGFDDSETWSLRDSIANFIIPRLKRYKEIIKQSYTNDDEYMTNIDEVLNAFQIVIDNPSYLPDDKIKEYEKGMKTFSEIFMGLWW